MSQKNIYYSEKYYDNEYEYRHVAIPKELVKLVPKTHLMSEAEWRSIGVQQSQGWVHYMTHKPEPHILLFKRKITTPPPEDNLANSGFVCSAKLTFSDKLIEDGVLQ